MFIDPQGYKIFPLRRTECFRFDLLRDRNIAHLWSFKLGLAAKSINIRLLRS
jgi:hypothetical protein